MTKKREGYQNVSFQFPDELYEAIERIANGNGVSLTTVIVERLCKSLKVPLPPRRRPGRKRKK